VLTCKKAAGHRGGGMGGTHKKPRRKENDLNACKERGPEREEVVNLIKGNQ